MNCRLGVAKRNPTSLIAVRSTKLIVKNQKVDKVKREGGAKHSDINFNAFLIQLMPECFAPTDLFVKKMDF